MEKYVVTIVAMLVIMLLEYKKNKCLMAATVIYPVMWMLALAGCIMQGDKYYGISWGTPIVIVSGYLMFCFGYNLMRRRVERKKVEPTPISIDNIGHMRGGIRVCFWLAVVVFILYMVKMWQYLDFGNILESIYNMRPGAKSEFEIPFWLEALRYVMRCTLWFFSFLLFSLPKGEKYRSSDGYNPKADLTVRLILVSIMSVLVLFSDFSRNDVLMTVTPVIFLYLTVKKIPDRKVFALLLMCFIAFIGVFGFVATMKSHKYEQSYEENADYIEESFTHYLTGSIVALDILTKDGTLPVVNFEGGKGGYTFSLVTAMADKALETDLTPYVVQEFVDIGDKVHTNVFTVYQWTGLDFGIVYALLWQFGFGMLYGVLFALWRRGRRVAAFFYSVMGYSLVMMFFEDQYFSIAQTWMIIMAILGMFFAVTMGIWGKKDSYFSEVNA